MKKEKQPHPEAIQAQQELIFKLWEQIPAEQQASLALMLVQAVQMGEWGPWLQDALDIQPQDEPEQPEADPRLTAFEITSVSRADLEQHFSAKEIAQFEDADMRELADKMSDWYVNQSFWTDMQLAAHRILDEKKRRE